jgi:two-component system, NtrC family, sensor kinase
MYLENVLAIIVSRYLIKPPHGQAIPQRWKVILNVIMYISIALMVINSANHDKYHLIAFASHILIAVLLYIGFTNDEFRFSRQIFTAMLPLVGVSILADLIDSFAPKFYDEYGNYFESAKFFAFVWLFAMWMVNRKQTKALLEERKKAEAVEKEKKITENLKSALEVQVAERTFALTQQTKELQHTIDELKSTQAQLIQSEKMASLGELTAGIAHEIQNPLNFVNNFSEINAELIVEMQEELEKGNLEEVKEIALNILDNEKKINHHGKRADGIVKGMLQHSRNSSGLKEPTDINSLTDEYLRLAYHGLRAKDKTFNATMKTDFDPAIGKINIMPQDIGRVILNLFTNAFYAVNEKKKSTTAPYEPTVSVSTKKAGGKTIIRVSDNGNGIPQKVQDKIFQPFFTTKPTGQGTGLGLSISFEIVTKAHGGELKMETKEGEGTTFIIELPA